MESSTELLRTEKFSVVQRVIDGREKALVQHPGAVVILPFVDADHICLIRNKRFAVEKTLVELPAGTLEPGEEAIITAQRELAEETGFRSDNLTPLFDYYVSPGILNEKMHAFIAKNLVSGEQNLMHDEEIEIEVVRFDDALAAIKNGQIEDAKTIATLLYYQQFVAMV
ncbi:NUDIX hydrolase [Pirellulaceae bacterium]|jgi:ADP-ribose pyrophosphatase|nr:NUDIX hydrolase [Pirellulaceae bacterium]